MSGGWQTGNEDLVPEEKIPEDALVIAVEAVFGGKLRVIINTANGPTTYRQTFDSVTIKSDGTITVE